MSIELIDADVQDPLIRQKLIDYLKDDEIHALFLIGNLVNFLQPSFYYLAQENEQIIAICSYYPAFQSASIYSQNSHASRLLARRLFERHTIQTLLGMEGMARPAVEELISLGLALDGSPDKLFLELAMDDFQPFQPKEGIVRSIEKKDADACVKLSRVLHHLPKDNPVTQEERDRLLSNPVKFCMDMDGKIVSMAISNGLGLEAFQILGVVTDPLFQRRGLAKAVCSHLILAMQEQGATKAIIFTDADNTAAIKCYAYLGFRITGRYCMATFAIE